MHNSSFLCDFDTQFLVFNAKFIIFAPVCCRLVFQVGYAPTYSSSQMNDAAYSCSVSDATCRIGSPGPGGVP